MKTTTLVATLVLALPIGCSLADIDDSESGDSRSDGVKLADTVCDFGAPTISAGNAYSVSVQDKDIKTNVKYFVEVKIGQATRSPAGKVLKQGTMVVDFEAWQAGSGTISVHETKVKKGVEERKLKAQCTFTVNSGGQASGGAGGGGAGGAGAGGGGSGGGGSAGAGSGGTGSGGTGSGGTDVSGEPWCIGEDTDVRPEREPPKGYCDICGGREFKSANWQDGKGCLEGYQKVAFKDTDSAECQAFIADKRDFCCAGFYESPVRQQCTSKMGPYQPVDLCDDGCFPSHPATAGVYSLQAGGPLAPFVNGLGNRNGTCYQDDGASANALVWTCRRAYYLLKYGHLPPHVANEVISWWSGHHALSANCGCDSENTNNPNSGN